MTASSMDVEDGDHADVTFPLIDNQGCFTFNAFSNGSTIWKVSFISGYGKATILAFSFTSERGKNRVLIELI